MIRKIRSKACGVVVTSFLTTALVLTGCTVDVPANSVLDEVATGTSTVTMTSTAEPSTFAPTETLDSTAMPEPVNPTESSTEQSSNLDIAAQLQSAVDQVVSLYGGSAGIAFSDGATTFSAGDVSPAAAWSTIKVPIAIAALRNDPSQSTNVEAAIQWSDNAAAEALWGSLGALDQAGLVTGSVLSEGGVQVSVNTVVTRSGFSSFGQTMWSTYDQARFAANLGCISGSAPILQNMAMVEPSQSWGIGQLPQAKFKGGWGPDPDGFYSARQFGLTTDPVTGQSSALAIFVKSGSGNFNDAQMMANALISEIQIVIPQAPTTSC